MCSVFDLREFADALESGKLLLKKAANSSADPVLLRREFVDGL